MSGCSVFELRAWSETGHYQTLNKHTQPSKLWYQCVYSPQYSPFISLGISWENLFKHHHISLAILHDVTLQGKLKDNHLNITKGFPFTASNMIIHPVGMLNNIIDTKISQWFSYWLICSECHPSCCHSSHTSLQVLSSSWQTFSLHWRWACTCCCCNRR